MSTAMRLRTSEKQSLCLSVCLCSEATCRDTCGQVDLTASWLLALVTLVSVGHAEFEKAGLESIHPCLEATVHLESPF